MIKDALNSDCKPIDQCAQEKFKLLRKTDRYEFHNVLDPEQTATFAQ